MLFVGILIFVFVEKVFIKYLLEKIIIELFIRCFDLSYVFFIFFWGLNGGGGVFVVGFRRL